MGALTGHDVLSEESVGTEVTTLLPSPASGESENWYPVRGLAGWGLGERAESFGLSHEASAQASGESENLPRPRGCPLALIFARLKQYFRYLLRVPLLAVSDSSPRASGGVRALSQGFDETWLVAAPVGIAFCTWWFRWVRVSAPAGCSPRGPRGVGLLLQGLFSLFEQGVLSCLPGL